MPSVSERKNTPTPDFLFANFLERRTFLVAGIALITALFWTALFFRFTADDAFIFFRYGKTLQLHHVWNWNPSGPRVEAYTSSLYGFLSIVPAFLHVPPEWLYKIVGLGSIAFMVWRLIKVAPSRFAMLLGVLFIGVNPYIWIHTYSCLETPLFMAVLFEFGLSVLRGASPAYVYSLAFLLPLTRPEGAVLSLVGLILYHRGRRPNWLLLTAFATLALAYFFARWEYFHQLLPNPFYVKVAHYSSADLIGNLERMKVYIFVLLTLAWLGRRSRVMILAALGLMILLYAPHLPLIMNFGDRFYFQMAVPMVLLFLATENARRVSIPVAILLAVTLLNCDLQQIKEGLFYHRGLQRSQVDIGKRLLPFTGHTLMLGDAGALPYYSDWMTYDYYALCSRYFVEHGRTEGAIEELKPELVLFYSRKPIDSDAAMFMDDRALFNGVKKSGHYAYIGASRSADYYLLEYLRTDTTQFKEIATTLQENVDRAR